jgi:hypothetical protein
MTVLDVYVNGRKRCRAGVGSDGVLTAIVNWVKLTGPAARTARRLKRPLEEARLHVGGLRGRTHRAWVDQNLALGDSVAIVLEKAAAFDAPIRQRQRAAEPAPARQETAFLNVDLDIWSRTPLEPLVKALGRRVFALHVGREGRGYVAHLEMVRQSKDPERLIRHFVALVRGLPPAKRRLWDSARRREFNIGIQSGPTNYELHLDSATVQAAAAVKAAVGVTVYGATTAGSSPR